MKRDDLMLRLPYLLALAAVVMMAVGAGARHGWPVGLAAGGAMLYADLKLSRLFTLLTMRRARK